MNNQWMSMSVLALSLSAITSTIYAEEQPVIAQVEQVQTEDSNDTEIQDAQSTTNTNSEGNDVNQAANALQKKEGDASGETNLQEVFTSNERQYSLIKKGVFSSYYDIDYTYYRDSRIDLATNDSSSSLARLRVEEDANHTLTNTFTVQYGVLDNVTLSASLPLMAKKDLLQAYGCHVID